MPASYSAVPTDATLLWADGDGDEDEDEEETYPGLDRGLRRLIGRMMARNYKDCPLLEDILFEASNAARRTARDYPGYEEEESDEACARFVRQFFFDAPPEAERSGGGDGDVFFDAQEGLNRQEPYDLEEMIVGVEITPPLWTPASPPKTVW
ncbi:hypothetical protein PG993_015265 [Apiospora rasikravindrae]|uniref:Uncharacterized protein n=1 Tax=Apiospora rasikravindrae TaxID=990691 RepID=A0ABR1RR87_9PEZI